MADVREHESVAFGDDVERAGEPRIVEPEALYVLVHLEPGAALAQRVADVAGRIGIVDVHGAERNRAGAELARGSREPRVEIARDSRFVRVGAERELLHAVLAQDARGLVRVGRVLEHPRASLGEPAANRREQTRRVQVRVNVDQDATRRRRRARPKPRSPVPVQATARLQRNRARPAAFLQPVNTPDDIARTASVHWEGDIARGKGTIAAESGQVTAGYSFGTRFSNEPGTNPEELLAASHAACFTMALTLALSRAGHPPAAIDTTARVHLRRAGQGFDVPLIELKTTATAAGLDADQFQQLAAAAKENCPISRALRSVEIVLDATLNV